MVWQQQGGSRDLQRLLASRCVSRKHNGAKQARRLAGSSSSHSSSCCQALHARRQAPGALALVYGVDWSGVCARNQLSSWERAGVRAGGEAAGQGVNRGRRLQRATGTAGCAMLNGAAGRAWMLQAAPGAGAGSSTMQSSCQQRNLTALDTAATLQRAVWTTLATCMRTIQWQLQQRLAAWHTPWLPADATSHAWRCAAS